MWINVCAEQLGIKPVNPVAMEAGAVILDTEVD